MLQGVTAGDLMSQECAMVPDTLSIDELVQGHILQSGGRCFLVQGGEGTSGMVTLHSIREIPRSRWGETSVSRAMLPFDAVKKVRVSDPIIEVLRWMDEGGVNQLPVMDDGNLVGMIRRDNLVGYIRTRSELQA